MIKMTLDEYQSLAAQTAAYPASQAIAYNALGLAGEAGEVANKVKKIIRDQGGIMTAEDKLNLKKELGDCLWYVSQAAREIGYTLGDVGQANIDKLADRKARGVIGGSGDNR